MKQQTASKILASKVNTFRAENALTVNDLANKTGLSSRTLNRIELGAHVPYNAHTSTLLSLSKVMRLPVSILIGQKV